MMSEHEQETTGGQDDAEATTETTTATTKGAGYHVSDLTEGQKPDPLGDASLTAQERATATSDAD
jgi:hypothetical protein